jgi:hypothetical protein
MTNLHVRVVGNEPNLAVLELETLRSEPAARALRQALGTAGYRVVSSEGMLSDQTLKERIYVSDQSDVSLSPQRFREIFGHALGVLEPGFYPGAGYRPGARTCAG